MVCHGDVTPRGKVAGCGKVLRSRLLGACNRVRACCAVNCMIDVACLLCSTPCPTLHLALTCPVLPCPALHLALPHPASALPGPATATAPACPALLRTLPCPATALPSPDPCLALPCHALHLLLPCPIVAWLGAWPQCRAGHARC